MSATPDIPFASSGDVNASAQAAAAALPAVPSQNGNGARHQIGRPFQPGKSGNPSGRPKANLALQELARGHTDEAIKTLVSIMKNGKAPKAARVAAAVAVLDRGWGRPSQAITGPGGGPLVHAFQEILQGIDGSRTERFEGGRS